LKKVKITKEGEKQWEKFVKRRDFTLADAARAHRDPLTVRHAEFFFFSFFFPVRSVDFILK
jgi:hypothetical protein